ncbi:hypothetical protein RB195_017929 [Necator americanus]|uniref:Uncharacterized protein n=1 Tax=Necator americanus TaxID=51031 RepID=A0ABR1C7D2_NECAM
MVEPDLSFIKSDIDLSEVAPLNRRRVVAFVNCYLLKMTDFLNDFAIRAERLILETERQLRAVDTKLQLLEAKLAAIPDPASKSIKQQVEERKAEFVNSVSTTQADVKEPGPLLNSAVEVADPAAEMVQSSAPVNTEATPMKQDLLIVKDDPAFAKYFKMLKLGVVEPAVKLKMRSEGVDPNLLDNPNAPSPNATSTIIPTDGILSQPDDSDSSSIPSFSDSD